MVFFASIRQFNLLQIEPRFNAFQLHNYIPMVMIWFMFGIVEIAHGKMFPDVHLQILEKLIALHVELFDWHLIDEQWRILLQKKNSQFQFFLCRLHKSYSLNVALVHFKNLLLRIGLNFFHEFGFFHAFRRNFSLIKLDVDLPQIQIGKFFR